MSSTSTTTADPTLTYEWGLTRKAGLTYDSNEKVSVVLPSPSASDMNPYAPKTYVQFDGRVGIFDGVGENKEDDGTNVYSFTVNAPRYAPYMSSTTTTTSTTTTSTSTTTTTTSSTTTT